MAIIGLSAAFTTDKVEETRDFYVRYFDATVTFDCGWYVNMELAGEQASLQFMSPQQSEHKLSSGDGLIYNILVSDVDEQYKRLTGEGLEVVVPLEDHPWGDRGFAVSDPNGIALYLYSLREPTDEFKAFFKYPE